MNEIKAEIYPLHSCTYDEILEVVYLNLPPETEEKSNFIDSIHQLFFNFQNDGIILKIENRIFGFLIFRTDMVSKIEVMLTRSEINQSSIFGLLLNYHCNKFNLPPENLQFKIWSHQSELISFLRHTK